MKKKTLPAATARPAGRPSLTGRRAVSPTLILRVDGDLLDLLAARAAREGTTVSAIARGVLTRAFGSGR